MSIGAPWPIMFSHHPGVRFSWLDLAWDDAENAGSSRICKIINTAAVKGQPSLRGDRHAHPHQSMLGMNARSYGFLAGQCRVTPLLPHDVEVLQLLAAFCLEHAWQLGDDAGHGRRGEAAAS